MLEMPAEWRFGEPGPVSDQTVNEIRELILKVTRQGRTWQLLEHFKKRFKGGASWSSSESWAGIDLAEAMQGAKLNGATFLDAFWSALEELKASDPAVAVPTAQMIEAILLKHGERFELRPPQLLLRSGAPTPSVTIPAEDLDEKARRLIAESLARADELLSHRHPRQAVQEILWLLETVATGFSGRETEMGRIEGKYLNDIAASLIRRDRNSTLAHALRWMTTLHGYLSSPSGGGVRHGTQLSAAIQIEEHEAKLYCDLTKSYIGYLLAELARMTPLQHGVTRWPPAST